MKESERQETCAKKLQFQEALKPISDSWSMDSDSDFEAPSCSIHSPLPVNTRSTPLNNIPDQLNPQTEQPEQTVFPRVKVRNSRFKINEQIVRCMVQCLTDYKVSPNDLTGIIVNTANIILIKTGRKKTTLLQKKMNMIIFKVTLQKKAMTMSLNLKKILLRPKGECRRTSHTSFQVGVQ